MDQVSASKNFSQKYMGKDMDLCVVFMDQEKCIIRLTVTQACGWYVYWIWCVRKAISERECVGRKGGG